MSETTCPVFHPSEQDFADFRGYLEQLEVLHPNMSICKIVPPKTWHITEYDVNTLQLAVKSPIRQITSGKRGVYDLEIYDEHDMSLQEFQQHAKSLETTKKNTHNHADIERQYWRSIAMSTTFQTCPLYGADLPGSLFQTSNLNEPFPQWNLNFLENTLRLMKETIPGVNTPMLYIGSWKSSFAYHVEDMDLYSINYVHLGAPKVWYGISPSERQRFEIMAQGYFPNDYRRCNQFLRHKTKLFSPMVLKDSNIKYVTAIQNAGEFMITFPGSYHAGFNHGFNIAEATNFALSRWFALGKEAIPCKCTSFCVKIDVEELETIYLREKIKCRKQGSNIRRILQHPEILKFDYFQHTLEEEMEYFPEADFRIRCFCSLEDIDSNAGMGSSTNTAFGSGFGSSSSSSSTGASSSGGRKGKSSSSSAAGVASSSGVDGNQDLTLLRCESCELWFHSECYVENQVDIQCIHDSICYQCSVINKKDEQARMQVLSSCKGKPEPAFVQSKLMKKPRSAHNTSSSSAAVLNASSAPSSSSSSSSKDISVKAILAAYNNDSMEDVIDLTYDSHPSQKNAKASTSSVKPVISRGSGRGTKKPSTSWSRDHSPEHRRSLSFSTATDDYFSDYDGIYDTAVSGEDDNSEARTSMDILTSPDQSPPHSSSSMASPMKIQKRGKKRKKIRVNDWVSLNWGGKIDVVGMIVNIDQQGQGRLHIKGTKKAEDTWVPLEKCQIIDAPLDSDEDKAGVPESRAPLAVVNILKLSNTVAAPKKVFKANASILAEAQSRPSSSSTLPASKILQHRLIAFSNLETEPPAITVKHPDKVKVVSDQKTTKTISIKTVAPPEANSTVVEQAPPMKPSFVPPSTTMFASSSSTSSSLTLMRTRKESVPKINCYSLLSTDEEDSDEHSDPRSIGKSCELDQNTADNWGYWPTEPSSLEQEGDKPYSAVKEEVDSEEEVEIKVSKTSSSSSKMPTTVHHHGKITMPLIASSSLHSITTGDGVAPRHKESPLVVRSTTSLPSSFSVQKDDHVYEGAAKIIHSSTLPTINYNQSIDWRNMPTHIKPSATVVDLLSWADDDDDEDEEDNEHDDSDVETAHHTSHPKIDSSRFAASNNGVFQRSAPLRVSEIIDLSF